MLRQIQKNSDKTFLVSADSDSWIEDYKNAAHLTPSEYNNEKQKLLDNYSDGELKTRPSNKRRFKFSQEDIEIRLQEIQSIKSTNKFAKIIKK